MLIFFHKIKVDGQHQEELQHIKQSILNPLHSDASPFVNEAVPGSPSIAQMCADGRNKFKTVNAFRLAAFFGPIFRADVPRLQASGWKPCKSHACACPQTEEMWVWASTICVSPGKKILYSQHFSSSWRWIDLFHMLCELRHDVGASFLPLFFPRLVAYMKHSFRDGGHTEMHLRLWFNRISLPWYASVLLGMF